VGCSSGRRSPARAPPGAEPDRGGTRVLRGVRGDGLEPAGSGIGVTADHLIVWDAAATRHLIAWPSVAGFDLEKRWTRGGDELTLVVICGNGRRLHTSGCPFSGTGERSWAAARQMVQALESERQARTPQSAAPWSARRPPYRGAQPASRPGPERTPRPTARGRSDARRAAGLTAEMPSDRAAVT
jgi:hypothetical protein